MFAGGSVPNPVPRAARDMAPSPAAYLAVSLVSGFAALSAFFAAYFGFFAAYFGFFAAFFAFFFSAAISRAAGSGAAPAGAWASSSRRVRASALSCASPTTG